MNAATRTGFLTILVGLTGICIAAHGQPSAEPTAKEPYASDSNPAFKYLEMLQESAIDGRPTLPRATNSEQVRAILTKLYERMDRSHVAAGEDAKFSETILPRLKAHLDSPMPTRFEDPLAIALLRESMASVIQGASSLDLPEVAPPELGTLPVASLDAQAIRVPKSDGYVITFNRQIFRLPHELTKIAIDTFEFERDDQGKLTGRFDFSREAFHRRVRADPEIKRRFALALVEYCSGRVQKIGNIQQPHHTGTVEVVVNSLKIFFAAHEYAHAVNADKPVIARPVDLEKGAGASMRLDALARSWRQELKADQLAFQLLERAQDWRGYTREDDDRLLANAGPMVLFTYMHVLDDAKLIWDTGKLPSQGVTAEEMDRVEKIARAELVDLRNLPAAPMNDTLTGHPPPWVRRRIAQSRLEEMFADATDAQRQRLRIANAICINTYLLFQEVQPQLPAFFQAIRRDDAATSKSSQEVPR